MLKKANISAEISEREIKSAKNEEKFSVQVACVKFCQLTNFCYKYCSTHPI
jgi:hypothetical protein